MNAPALTQRTGQKTLVCAALVIQLAQALDLLFLPRPLWFSNFVQCLLPVIALLLCVLLRKQSADRFRRAGWSGMALAFTVWSVAEITYLAELYYLPRNSNLSWPDDVLWMLFALPILSVTTVPLRKERNWLSLLDHAQAFVYFGILLASVFCLPHAIPFNTAYNLQNLTLLLSCLLSLSAADSKATFRFYAHLTAYLAIYCGCAWLGNSLQAHGMAPGSTVDLFWTIPITAFCLLAYRSGGGEAESGLQPPRFKNVSRLTQGLSALALAVVSLGASAAVLAHQPVLGFAFLVGSFSLFAIRTMVREFQSQKSADMLRQSSMRDPLTGLGNRTRFRLDVQHIRDHEVRPGMKLALLFVDLDRFKEINDELGHHAGDVVLVEVAHRLQRASRSDDSVCRIGGDEFVFSLIVSDDEIAHRRAEELRTSVAHPFTLNGKAFNVTASIGVVIGQLEEGTDSLMRRADDAMYRAKKLGKNQVRIFDRDADEHTRSQWTLEQDLQRDLARENVQVAYQPIYSAEENRVAGFEALARWNHSQHGPMSPAVFIPLAEQAGLIHQLGSLVLARACRQVAEWNRVLNERLFVSVNISVKQFSEPDLLTSILRTLEETGLPAELLHLEITESVLLMQDCAVEEFLTQARDLGIRISLDDFGTGYSSLSYLLNLPVDEIKIDRSFIHNIQADPLRVELVRAVMSLGRTLGKQVVAEGVESQDQLEILSGLGCTILQGYVIARPLMPEAADEFLRRAFLTHPVPLTLSAPLAATVASTT